MSHYAPSGGGGWITPGKMKFISELPPSVKQVIKSFHELNELEKKIGTKDHVPFPDVEHEAAREAEKKVARNSVSHQKLLS